ncbi:unnamed protein product [Allacma fusca]|uniref:Transglutaminase-like domain-containing protein n=1 Tax=Allacma fusca TaxID=39272 RepID=A0A8J2PJD9_9HEXA|nr:unnamed protein product [Allacma fusca]
MSMEHHETAAPRLSWFSRFRAQKPAAAPAEIPTGSEDGILQVQKTDLKFLENGKLHHTDEYDLMSKPKEPQLVVRRGQEFSIDLYFDRPYVKGTYEVKLIFALEGVKHRPGKELIYNDATFVTVPVTEEKTSESSTGWFAHIANIQETQVTIQLKAPPRCAVGKWNVKVEIKPMKGDMTGQSFSLPKPMVIIFNPWCPEDDTYLASDEDRDEYVMNDVGCIFKDTVHNPFPCSWTYSQFEPDILDCALYLLNHNCSIERGLKPAERGLGVPIVRLLTAVVNWDPENDHGVLEGNWTKHFSGGKRPEHWSGSQEILQEYYRTKKTVKYGQCWVFAGVLTTICRALGIPCRPVTNYGSAHEKEEYSFTVDHYIDEDGKKVEGVDSSWTFHVWCEVWLRRDDLSGDYSESGWQAVDATMQEKSGKTFQMGPAPVEACKRGDVLVQYDVGFLFSEVNSDIVTWRWLGEDVPPRIIKVESRKGIGQKISTKAKNSHSEREDLTLNYKYKEGSPEEREAFNKAVKQSECRHAREYLNQKINEVKFEFEMEEATIGDVFKMNVVIKNDNESEEREGQVKIKIDAVNNASKILDNVAMQTFEFKVGPKSEERRPITVDYVKYKKVLGPDGLVNILCDARVNNPKIEYTETVHFAFSKPNVTFKIPQQTIRVDEDFDITVSIKNPLPVPLNKGYFAIDAPGIIKKIVSKRVKDCIKPGETGSVDFTLHPHKSGKRTITAKFYSTEIYGADGMVQVYISPSENNIMPS